MSETRAEYYAGIKPDEVDSLRQLACLLDAKALAHLVAQLEAVIGFGYGDVMIGVSGGKAVIIKTTISRDLRR